MRRKAKSCRAAWALTLVVALTNAEPILGSSALVSQPASRNHFPGFADRHTVVLWLFDEPAYPYMNLTDAGAHLLDLRLFEEGRLVAGKYGNALRFVAQSGPAAGYSAVVQQGDYWKGDRVFRPQQGLRPGLDHILSALRQGDWTWEFWLRLDAVPDGEVVLVEAGQGARADFSWALTAGARAFQVQSTLPGATFRQAFATSGRSVADGKWHHLACTRAREDGVVTFYLDGRRQHRATPIERTSEASDSPLRPGLVGVNYSNSGLVHSMNREDVPAMSAGWGPLAAAANLQPHHVPVSLVGSVREYDWARAY